MKCHWKWCCEEATVHLFRPVDGVKYEYSEVPPGSRRRPKRHRIWNERLNLCDTCQPAAQGEYDYVCFVPPNGHESEYRPGRIEACTSPLVVIYGLKM